MALGGYFSDAGAQWNSSQIAGRARPANRDHAALPGLRHAHRHRVERQYHVIGWVGFHLTAHTEHGSNGTLKGWFTEVVWTGIAVTKATGQPNLGARVVQLID